MRGGVQSRFRPHMKTTFDAELLVRVDRASDVPLRLQIEREVRSAVQSGRLGEGARLPSSRAFATALRVGRGVVVDAYEQLAAEGYLHPQSGSGTRVASRGHGLRPTGRACPVQVVAKL